MGFILNFFIKATNIWYSELGFLALNACTNPKKIVKALIEKRKLVDNGEYRVKSGIEWSKVVENCSGVFRVCC